MPQVHVAQEHECLNDIAARYGLLPEAIWNDPGNAELRELRQDPNVLLAGDVLTIPALQQVRHAAQTGRRYRFRRKGVPVQVQVRLLSGSEPRKDARYLLEVDGEALSGTTGPDGDVTFWVMPGSQQATLELEGEERYELKLSRLDPATEASGVRQRLINLGYLDVEGDEDELAVAVIAFKREHCGLELTPEDLLACDDDAYERVTTVDDRTRTQLIAIHGS
ncbi:LysM domain-containing protein [Myxococcus sp. CA033]|uniref:LysM peptidoglycan-binding domain-containing protein n=1 Tax=Myxococcus sp. CA033 TaxID=2741516 RepID=UPI001C2D0A12|nr:LysM domain-containing protein [Myxococcus sp. CA033]